MGFSASEIQYRVNFGTQQPSGWSRMLGNMPRAGQATDNYWTRITVQTDSAGCSQLYFLANTEAQDGAYQVGYNEGAQLIVTTDPSDPNTLIGPTKNLDGIYLGNNQPYWKFEGYVAVNMRPNTTYYIIILPCWTVSNKFIRSVSNMTLVSTADLPSYTLNLSEGVGTTLAVSKGGTPLHNGDTVLYGDVLTASASANTGYTLDTFTVNGTPWTSGDSWTVTGTPTVASTATPNSYTLSISQGAGSTISVTKNGVPLSDGDTVYYSDTLGITILANAGYNLSVHTVNGSDWTTGSYTVTGNVAVVSTAALKTYTLSISQGSGTTISVTRGGVALANGATITHFDVLTIAISANTGYNLATHTVNGSDWTTGNLTVTGAVTVISTGTLKTYTLTINQGSGSTITVTRGGSPLSDGATITHFDVLSITISANTGYDLVAHTVNGSNWTSGSYTVAGAVAVVSTAALKSWSLGINAGTGSVIEVEKNGVPMSDGDTVYYGDILSVVFYAQIGYTIATRTINGSSVGASVTLEVTNGADCAATATLNVYHLSITTSPSGVVTTVLRTSSPLNPAAVIGQIGSGAEVYYGDVLVVSYALDSGYTEDEATINGTDFSSGASVVASGDVAVVVLAKAAGFIYIENEPYLIVIGNGSTYDRYLAIIGNGSTYDRY